MSIPVVSSFRELDPAPRKFLLFTSFNVVSWQCVVGTAMILLARSIDMPPSWVGFLISFLPLSMILVVFTIRLVNHLGAKRVMLVSWFLRNTIVGLVFFMPWAMGHGGMKLAWGVLMAAVLGFCLMRAFGAGAWFPWLHEVVPPKERATFFGTETAIAQVMNIGVTLLQGVILGDHPSVGRFLLLYAMGISSGLISLVWMSKVPGGQRPESPGSDRRGFMSHGLALKDRSFLTFTVIASLCLFSMSSLGSSIVMYMKDALGFNSNRIMNITAAGSVGILLTIRFWEQYTAHRGSRRTMTLTLVGYAMVAGLWLFLFPKAPWTLLGVLVAVILANVFSAAFWMAAHRSMLNRIQPGWRTEYTSLWTAGTSLASGLSPILVGQAIQRWEIWGFRACFAATLLSGLGCALAMQWILRDEDAARPPSLKALLKPSLAFRILGQVFRITVGLDRSHRQQEQRSEKSSSAPRDPL